MSVPGSLEATGGTLESAVRWVGVTRDELLDRVAIDPQVAFGKPVIRGTRIWVGLILGLLSDGMTHDEVLADYPHLTDDDLRACLAYSSAP